VRTVVEAEDEIDNEVEDRTEADRAPVTALEQHQVLKGHTTEMHGHVFECFSEGTKQGQFTKTIEALGE
jgi:hypothetical protein